MRAGTTKRKGDRNKRAGDRLFNPINDSDTHRRKIPGEDRLPEFLNLCKHIQKSLPNVKSLALWLKLTRKELDNAIANPEGQPWLQAIKSLSIGNVQAYFLLINHKRWPIV